MSLADSFDYVCQHDPILARIRARLGDPPAFRRPATFATLVRIILEQQVSLASGHATFKRLRTACGGVVNAKRVRVLDSSRLTECGLSRQKARYVASLANEVGDRRFSVTGLARLDDDDARTQITSQLGMGDWTADIYLMMALGRPDIFPIGDLALVKGIMHLDQATYTPDEILARGECWRPYRSSATRLIWADYLDRQRAAAK